MKINKSSYLHLIPIALFFIIVSIFFAPLYSGKTLVQSDNVQLTGVNKEVSEYNDKGEQIHWNPREFSGVPLQPSSNYNLVRYLNLAFFYSLVPKPIAMVFFLFLGMYILLQVFAIDQWLSGVGAMAYAMASFNIISVEVGHDNKVLAIAFMAPVLAGVILTYKGRYFKGGLLTMVSAAFELLYGHIQIAYYLFFIVIGYVLLILVNTIKEKKWNEFLQASAVLTVATVVAFGCNFSRLSALVEYSSYSTRGGTELTQENGDNASRNGLDKDYALSWSSGKLEILTLMFPYFHGGASSEELDKDSNTYQNMISRGVNRGQADQIIANVPLYWGNQPFTGGPIYFGCIVCFLFLLGLVILHDKLKWWVLALVIISLLLAMGKNLEWFTNIFFYYVPLYNKFRSVTMIVVIAQLLVPLLGIIALDKILSKELDKDDLIRKTFQVSGVVIGLSLFFILFKSVFFDFEGSNDQAYGLPDWLINSIIEDRESLYTSDIIRSIIFILMTAVGIIMYLKGIVKKSYFLTAICFLVLIDMWAVNKRYLGENDFQTQKRISQIQFQKTRADETILSDKGYFRVLNLSSGNPFSDGITSFHHYSILGYSAIKMQRYQELIDKYIREMNESVLGMLNTKYYIVKGQNGPIAQRNTKALGNAWLVEKVSVVEGVNNEYKQLDNIDPGVEAIIDQSIFTSYSPKTYAADGTVELSNYHPEHMTYTFESSDTEFVVFSEIYYAPGWNAYIDGELTNHARVNYILRGMEVPAGKHVIEFIYEPFSQVVGKWIVLTSSILLIVSLGFFIYYERKTLIRS